MICLNQLGYTWNTSIRRNNLVLKVAKVVERTVCIIALILEEVLCHIMELGTETLNATLTTAGMSR